MYIGAFELLWSLQIDTDVQFKYVYISFPPANLYFTAIMRATKWILFRVINVYCILLTMLCIYNYIFLIKLSNGFVVFVNKRCCVGLSDGFVGGIVYIRVNLHSVGKTLNSWNNFFSCSCHKRSSVTAEGRSYRNPTHEHAGRYLEHYFRGTLPQNSNTQGWTLFSPR